MKKYLFILISVYWSTVFSQTQKTLNAFLSNSTIEIDGQLDESVWDNAEIATNFTQSTPVFGAPASQKTEVKVAYDNNAIYIAAILYDQSKDSISTTLSNRDDVGNADYFGVIIDTYGNSTLGFGYLVTSAGVQIDDLRSDNGIDNQWNSVWESSTKIHDDKWIAEIKIPFSAIRFPNQDIQNWRINFKRTIRRNREDSFWNTYNPNGVNFLSQCGNLKNLKGIKSPIRLSLYPYVSTYLENKNQSTNYRFNAGMDLKYGINEAFTVDMTLIPDFGQVKFDQQVLNLSPFEVQYNENRQFFTEGTEIFNKAGLFYSRRVGGSPINQFNIDKNDNEIITSNPGSTPLLNATKISGRTKSGLGIGFFNGITRSVHATVRDTTNQIERQILTSPFSNYNVLVFDQNLINNSSVTLTNTSVWRSGKTYDANVTAVNFDLYEQTRTYNLFGDFSLSQKYGPQNSFGIKSSLGAEKASGLFKYGLNADISDTNFDPNDLGFLSRNNYQRYNAFVQYNTVKPFWRIYNSWSELYFNYTKLFTPNVYTNASIESNLGCTFKNFMAVGAAAGYYFENNDYFESRIDGKYYTLPSAVDLSAWISSNYAKPFALDISINTTRFNSNRFSNYLSISPRFRFSDKFSMILISSIKNSINEKGLALTTNYSTIIENEDPIFGQRDRQTIENSVTANYIFTNRMGFSFELRHYWAKVKYSDFYTLNNNGHLIDSEYTGQSDDDNSLHNNNFNAFTIDMVYKWVFAPGSQLSLVWKNSIFSSSNLVDLNYFENTNNLGNLPSTNSLSFKLLYFLDYQNVINKNRR